MDLIYWLTGFGVIVAGAVTFLVLRARRSRQVSGDRDAAIHGERSHAEAIAAAHTAGVARGPH